MSERLSYGDLSHNAVVVNDLDGALARYRQQFGLSFAPTYLYPGLTIDTDERDPVEVPLTWSVQGPPHLELITATPRTMWSTPGLHHVGFWTADVAGDAARLQGDGFVLEYTYGGPGRPVTGFAYLADGDGMRVELTSDRFKPTFNRWRAGAPFELG